MSGPECHPCRKSDQVFNKNTGEFLRCKPPRPRPCMPRLGKLCPQTNLRGRPNGSVIGGFHICDDGKVKDPRGVCKTAYTFSPPKEKKDVEPREITSPKPKINLREYLQRLHSF